MGYGWMAGLGQAMQQVGSEQIPQYLARRRQGEQDKQAAEQQALANALARDRFGLEQSQFGLQQDQFDEAKQVHQDTLGLQRQQEERLGRASFFDTELPMLYGRTLDELGQPQRDALTKYGITPDPSGRIAPSWRDAQAAKESAARTSAALASARASGEQVEASREGRTWANVARVAEATMGSSTLPTVGRLLTTNPMFPLDAASLRMVDRRALEENLQRQQAIVNAARIQKVPEAQLKPYLDAITQIQTTLRALPVDGAQSGGSFGEFLASQAAQLPAPPKR